MITIHEVYVMLLSFTIGILSGLFFYLGLYWTTKKAMTCKNPGLLFGTSFLIRPMVVCFAFYFAMQNSMVRLLFCFAGFIVARIVSKYFVEARTKSNL